MRTRKTLLGLALLAGLGFLAWDRGLHRRATEWIEGRSRETGAAGKAGSAGRPGRRGAGGGGDRKIAVEVAPVRRQILEETLEFSADIRGRAEALVYPDAPGKLRRKIRQVGQKVKAGEVLAVVDRDEPGLKYETAEVRSPIAGVLTRYLVDEGSQVEVRTPILEVADLEKVRVVFQPTEKELPKIQVGQEVLVKVDAFPSETFRTRIHQIHQTLDPASRTARAEAELDNPGFRLKPGMFGRAHVILDRREAIAVPRAALGQDLAGDAFVFRIRDGRAEYVQVKVGWMTSEIVEILSGLSEEETVATTGRQNLTDGISVRVGE